ncbi:hypothetical protein Tco_0503567 [Tanacetum coccineum]
MEAHLDLTQPTQVNKITTPYEICSGPHDTQNCMENPEQAWVDYASSHTNEIRDKKFVSNQGPRNFNEAANTWKDKPNFNWEQTQTFTNPQNKSISVHSSSYQIKLEKALLDFDSNQEKRLSHLHTQFGQHQDYMIGKINLLLKIVSKKLNNTSAPENAGNTMAHKSIAAISHDEKEELRKKGIKSPSKLFSPKYLSPASIKELNKNPSAPKRIHFVNLIIILSTDSDTEEEDTSSTNKPEHELNDMVIRSEGVKEQGKKDDETETDMVVEEVIEEEERIVTSRMAVEASSTPVGKGKRRVKRIKVFIGSFTYECDFMILEDTSSIIDRHLGEMIFEKTFIDETGLIYNEEKGIVIFKQGDEKITFKRLYTIEVFKQTWLMRLSTDSIPPSAHEENFGNGRTHYYQSLLIEDEYKQDEGDRRGG